MVVLNEWWSILPSGACYRKSYELDLCSIDCFAICTLLLRYCLLLSKNQSRQLLVAGSSHLHTRLLLFPEVHHRPFDSRFTLDCCCGIGRIGAFIIHTMSGMMAKPCREHGEARSQS